MGVLFDFDPPSQPYVLHQTPPLGSEIEVRLHFKEFCRMEIGKKWYRFSDHTLWRLHSKLKKTWIKEEDDTDGDGKASGTEGKMRNNGSVSDETNGGWE